MGLNASPVAEVARPACQMLHCDSGAGSRRESYERSNAAGAFFGLPLYTAVIALKVLANSPSLVPGCTHVFVRFSLVSYNSAFALPHLPAAAADFCTAGLIDMGLLDELMERLSALAGVSGETGGRISCAEPSVSLPSSSNMVCSRTQSRIASSSFEALKSVDRNGIPAMVLSVSKTRRVMRTYTSLHVSRSSLRRPSMIAISPPVPVPPIRSKWSHGLGVSFRRGARPWISTYVRCMSSCRSMSIE